MENGTVDDVDIGEGDVGVDVGEGDAGFDVGEVDVGLRGSFDKVGKLIVDDVAVGEGDGTSADVEGDNEMGDLLTLVRRRRCCGFPRSCCHR